MLPSEKQQINRVAIGIGMVRLAIELIVLVVIVAQASFIFTMLSVTPPSVIAWLVRILLPVFITAQSLATIGPCLCLAAPAQAKSTHFVLASVAFNALSTVIVAFGLVVVLPLWLSTAAFALPFIATMAFVLFVSISR